MSRFLVVAFTGALCVQAAAVMAADMPQELPPPPPERIEPPIPNFNQGWYLRGDLGYNWGAIQGAQAASGFPSPSDNKLEGSFMAGVGAGIKTQWLRTDLTVDYSAPMKYQGTILSPNDTTAKISAVSTLFNGYIDLGTWYNATPYIGAGAGAAYLTTSDYVSPAAPPFSGNTSHSQWNFAWAVMAGIGYVVGPNLLVDVGYRYIDFGDVRTNTDAFGAMTFKNIAAHEVRVGLRWSFDDYPTR